MCTFTLKLRTFSLGAEAVYNSNMHTCSTRNCMKLCNVDLYSGGI